MKETVFDQEELNIIRQWFNAMTDINEDNVDFLKLVANMIAEEKRSTGIDPRL